MKFEIVNIDDKGKEKKKEEILRLALQKAPNGIEDETGVTLHVVDKNGRHVDGGYILTITENGIKMYSGFELEYDGPTLPTTNLGYVKAIKELIMGILIDYNQVVVSNLAVHAKNFPEFSENLVRHMILNSLKSYMKKFKRDFGPEVLVCCDSREDYWRKTIFPYYKANRKKERENSPIPWKDIFPILNKLKVELKEVFPYKVLEISGAEADDIIGTLLPRMIRDEKKLLISADGDFIQLQAYVENLKQWDPIRAKFVKSDDPVAYLKEHIIQGDKGDGIPNCLSQDDTFVAGHRQVTINSKAKEKWLTMLPEDYTDVMQRGYARNKKLIDLREIPMDIKESIIVAYETTPKGSKQKLMKYCIQYNLKEIMAELDAF